jgi:formate dehydrogenase subunit delta
MHDDGLVRMANQIADFFRHRPHDQAVEGAADHIRKFWDPRMRAKMIEHLAHGGDGLSPLALEAATLACKPAPVAGAH